MEKEREGEGGEGKGEGEREGDRDQAKGQRQKYGTISETLNVTFDKSKHCVNNTHSLP